MAGGWSYTVDQGARFYRQVALTDAAGSPVDLTGYTARMQWREDFDPSPVIMECSTLNGRITIPTPTNGTLVIAIDSDDTAVLDFDTAIYDLELTRPDGEVIRILEGSVSLSREVTK